MRYSFKKEKQYKKKKTLCIDLLNTFVVKDEFADQTHLEAISQDKEFFYENYIVVKDHSKDKK